MRLGPFLAIVKADKLSLITILELMRLNGTGGITDGMKTARALLAVGKGVESEYKAQMCRKNNIHLPNISKPGDQGFFTRFGYRELHARRVAAAKYMEDAEEWAADWTPLVRVKVGSILVDSLMHVAEVQRTCMDKRTGEEVCVGSFPLIDSFLQIYFSTELQPAFFHSYEYSRGHKLGVIKLNPAIANRLAKDAVRETLHPRHLPMLVKPKPWIKHDDGGYLNNKSASLH
jgi:DNA-directed RNA polymerase